jgi:hypothetical protein
VCTACCHPTSKVHASGQNARSHLRIVLLFSCVCALACCSARNLFQRPHKEFALSSVQSVISHVFRVNIPFRYTHDFLHLVPAILPYLAEEGRIPSVLRQLLIAKPLSADVKFFFLSKARTASLEKGLLYIYEHALRSTRGSLKSCVQSNVVDVSELARKPRPGKIVDLPGRASV